MALSESYKSRIAKLAGIKTLNEDAVPQTQPQTNQQQQPAQPQQQQPVQQNVQQPKFPDRNQIEELFNNIKKMFENEKARVGDSYSSYTDIPSKFDVVIKHEKTTNNTDYLDIYMERKNKNYLDHILQQFGGNYDEHNRNPNLISLTRVRGIKK